MKGARVSLSISGSGGGHPQNRPRVVRRVLLTALERELSRLRELCRGDADVEGAAAQVEALVSAYLATLPPSYVGEEPGEGEGC